MSAERYARLRAIVHAAGEREGDARRAYLDEACGDDAALRREAEELLTGPDVATGDLLPPPVASSLPAALGRYTIVREVGRGGMGAVYEATDTRDGTRVALKIVHPHLAANPRLLERFARESRLGRAVDHPNVVRTLAVDEADVGGQTLPYLVLEFVDGQNLRALLDGLGTVPEAFLLEIARQVLEGLDAVHGHGIVHRDMKPENILVTDDNRVRLMDLGVAKLQDATVALTTEGFFIGSLHYAAPEQCHGGEVGPAADLYALGVVLYELATGTNPFRCDTPGAVIQAHLTLRPPTASDVNPDVSPFFSEVIATLLAKDPDQRFASARGLAETLAAGEASPWWTGRVHGDGIPRIAVSRTTGLHGRRDELGALQAAWGEGGSVWLEGEPGLGKTRLVDSFLRSLAGDDVHLLYGSFPPSGGMRGLAEAIVGKFGDHGLAAALPAYLEEDAARLAPFLSFLRSETAPPLDLDRFRALCCRLLRNLAAEKPTVWVMDDLHFAPDAVRQLVLAMARAAHGTRALLLLTSRGLPNDEAVGLGAVPGLKRLALRRLEEDEVAGLVREALGDDRHAERIVKKSDGVPFFVFELIKALQESGELEVPSAVRDLIAARVGGLDKEERAILDVAAVDGYEFDVDRVATALERPVVQVLQDLAEIERRGGIVRAAGRRYRFDHHQVQEVLYGDLPERLREEYHSRLAAAYTVPDPKGGRAHLLAHHHLHGARPEEGLPYLEDGLDYLDRRYLHEASLELTDRALDVPAITPVRRVELLLRRAERLDALARRAEQALTTDQAVTLAGTLDDRSLHARAEILKGRYGLQVGNESAALAHYDAALALARRAGDKTLEAEAVGRVGGAYIRMRRDEESLDYLARSKAMAKSIGDRERVVVVTIDEAIALRHLGRADEAIPLLEEALAEARALDLRRSVASCEGQLGTAYLYVGLFREAGEHLARQRRMSREVGNVRDECHATANGALVLMERGRLGEARDALTRHRKLAEEVSDPRSLAVALRNLSQAYFFLGDLDQAGRLAVEAYDLAKRVDARHIVAGALLARGHLARARGDDEEASRCYEEALAGLAAIDAPYAAARVRLALARLPRPDAREHAAAARDTAIRGKLYQTEMAAHVLLGEPAKAEQVLADRGERIGHFHRLETHFDLGRALGSREHYERARVLLEEARRFAPPEYRESMARHMPLHAAIVAATAR